MSPNHDCGAIGHWDGKLNDVLILPEVPGAAGRTFGSVNPAIGFAVLANEFKTTVLLPIYPSQPEPDSLLNGVSEFKIGHCPGLEAETGFRHEVSVPKFSLTVTGGAKPDRIGAAILTVCDFLSEVILGEFIEVFLDPFGGQGQLAESFCHIHIPSSVPR